MSRALLASIVLCALGLAAARLPAQGNATAAQVGQAAPAFLLDTLDGSSMTGNFDGRPAYINVFATWCPPCRGELPSIVQKARQYRDRIVFVFVDEQEPAKTVQSFAQRFGVGPPVAVDRGQFAATFAVGGLPESIFIDRHGVVQYIYKGLIPESVLGDELARIASN